MKKFWIVVLVVLLVFNLSHLFYECILPFIKEQKKISKNGVSHDKCSYLSKDKKCNLRIVSIWRKIRKKSTTVCPGAKGCMFFISEDINTGEIKRANFFFLLLNSIFSHIPSITALVLTVYEIINLS